MLKINTDKQTAQKAIAKYKKHLLTKTKRNNNQKKGRNQMKKMK